MNSGAHSTLPPDVSGALRYERVAQLETVLRLRDDRRRLGLRRLVIAVATLSAAAAAWMVWSSPAG